MPTATEARKITNEDSGHYSASLYHFVIAMWRAKAAESAA